MRWRGVGGAITKNVLGKVPTYSGRISGDNIEMATWASPIIYAQFRGVTREVAANYQNQMKLNISGNKNRIYEN